MSLFWQNSVSTTLAPMYICAYHYTMKIEYDDRKAVSNLKSFLISKILQLGEAKMQDWVYW
jgi:hypothetical protein